jgi:hypothetical protein
MSENKFVFTLEKVSQAEKAWLLEYVSSNTFQSARLGYTIPVPDAQFKADTDKFIRLLTKMVVYGPQDIPTKDLAGVIFPQFWLWVIERGLNC